MEVDELEVELADGNTVEPKHKGDVLADIGIMIVELSTVYFISKLQLNLLSCCRH